MQAALDLLHPNALQLFAESVSELELAQAGLVPRFDGLLSAWVALVTGDLTGCNLRIPDGISSKPAGRNEHTPHLELLVTEMQEVARLEAGAAW
jgi:ring-1,2-phenylacetyl-CoA epoxidase subunit PaaC